MKQPTRRTLTVSALIMAMLLLNTMVAAAAPRMATYRIEVTNLTTGQPLSPPVLVAHDGTVRLYRVGNRATYEIMQLAENGDSGPLKDVLRVNSAVRAFTDVADGAFGPEPLVPRGNPGSNPFSTTATYTLQTPRNTQYLSLIAMLVCTNDGFAAVDNVQLTLRPGQRMTLWANTYDAGTEINTEKYRDLVPSCQRLTGTSGDRGTTLSNPRLAEHRNVRAHKGITGSGDLNRTFFNWSGPAARIVISRLS